MKKKKKLGEIGEEIAARYLLRNKYRILERNWTFEKKEIDIIAQKDNYLVIVEVKTRSDPDIERLDDLVNHRKQKYLIVAADAYIREYEVRDEIRFDVILVTFKDRKPVIEHFEDAFYPDY